MATTSWFAVLGVALTRELAEQSQGGVDFPELEMAAAPVLEIAWRERFAGVEMRGHGQVGLCL